VPLSTPNLTLIAVPVILPACPVVLESSVVTLVYNTHKAAFTVTTEDTIISVLHISILGHFATVLARPRPLKPSLTRPIGRHSHYLYPSIANGITSKDASSTSHDEPAYFNSKVVSPSNRVLTLASEKVAEIGDLAITCSRS